MEAAEELELLEQAQAKVSRAEFGESVLDGGEVRQVRLAEVEGGTTLQVLFTHPEYGICLFGWEFEFPWKPNELGRLRWIEPLDSFEEDIATKGLPESCEPDDEGVTWFVDPYGGRSYEKWTFLDHVEQALRRYSMSARPVTRREVDGILRAGAASVADLEEIASESGPNQRTAAWLLTEFREGSRIERAVESGRPTWFERNTQHPGGAR
jgi:hypothetical protein